SGTGWAGAERSGPARPRGPTRPASTTRTSPKPANSASASRKLRLSSSAGLPNSLTAKPPPDRIFHGAFVGLPRRPLPHQAHGDDPLDSGAPGEYLLAHGGHSTRPGRGRRERRYRPRR